MYVCVSVCVCVCVSVCVCVCVCVSTANDRATLPRDSADCHQQTWSQPHPPTDQGKVTLRLQIFYSQPVDSDSEKES